MPTIFRRLRGFVQPSQRAHPFRVGTNSMCPPYPVVEWTCRPYSMKLLGFLGGRLCSKLIEMDVEVDVTRISFSNDIDLESKPRITDR